MAPLARMALDDACLLASYSRRRNVDESRQALGRQPRGLRPGRFPERQAPPTMIPARPHGLAVRTPAFHAGNRRFESGWGYCRNAWKSPLHCAKGRGRRNWATVAGNDWELAAVNRRFASRRSSVRSRLAPLLKSPGVSDLLITGSSLWNFTLADWSSALVIKSLGRTGSAPRGPELRAASWSGIALVTRGTRAARTR